MRKKLGQHFLTHNSTKILVANTITPSKDEIIIEIGPGKGAITKYLLKHGVPVYAIEKDPLLAKHIKENYPTVNLIEKDVRNYKWEEEMKDKKYIIIANIPYYLTGSLLRNILTSKNPPRAMALVIQKEVADRILKRDGKESLLSLSVKLYGTPKIEKKIKSLFFSPPPNVDSTLITINDIHTIDSNIENRFFEIITIAFKEKRKVVLKKFQNNSEVFSKLKTYGITEKTRAEEIDFDIWYSIAKQ